MNIVCCVFLRHDLKYGPHTPLCDDPMYISSCNIENNAILEINSYLVISSLVYGCILKAPSRRIISPFNMGFSIIV